MSQIPVICDRCRASGTGGEGDFTHLGDLLEFDPVPRKTKRVNGWTPERQRAFIAALSATGSPRDFLAIQADKSSAPTVIEGLRARGIRHAATIADFAANVPPYGVADDEGKNIRPGKMLTDPYSRIRASLGEATPLLRTRRVPSFC